MTFKTLDRALQRLEQIPDKLGLPKIITVKPCYNAIEGTDVNLCYKRVRTISGF